MADGEIRKGDIGTVFTITVMDGSAAVDISTATTKNIVFKKPDKTILPKAGSFVTDGTDGKISYTTVSGDLSKAGEWCVQGAIVMPAGTWKTDIDHFTVYANLE